MLPGSPAGWINDAGYSHCVDYSGAVSQTCGNNVRVVRRSAQVGATGLGANRVFEPTLSFDPANYPGEGFPPAYDDAAMVQAFYTTNVWHDRMYALGFDEEAGNFQRENFGRGGVEEPEQGPLLIVVHSRLDDYGRTDTPPFREDGP